MNCAAITWPISERILEYIEAADFPRELIATQVHFTELLEFHRFVRPGDELTINGCIAAIEPHRAGTLVIIRFAATDQDNKPVFTEYIGGLMREVTCRGEAEDHIAKLAGVYVVEVIGMKHKIFDDGIFAFVKPKKGATLSAQAVMDHCKDIASYKRPQHLEIWPPDRTFPLTRSTKVDKIALQRLAEPIIEALQKAGEWDAKQVV
jgi:hypothetical protein